MPTIPDIDATEGATGFGETGFDMDTDVVDSESSTYDDRDEDDTTESETASEGSQSDKEDDEEDEDESFFSEKKSLEKRRHYRFPMQMSGNTHSDIDALDNEISLYFHVPFLHKRSVILSFLCASR